MLAYVDRHRILL